MFLGIALWRIILHTGRGGGIYTTRVEMVAQNSWIQQPSDPLIINSTISENSATGDGGGVYSDKDLEISHSTIVYNEAGLNAVVVLEDTVSPRGGGLFANGDPLIGIADTVLNHTIITDNVDLLDDLGVDLDGINGLDTEGTTNNVFLNPIDINALNEPAVTLIKADYSLLGDVSHLHWNDSTGYVVILSTDMVEEDIADSTTVGVASGVDPNLLDNGGPTRTHALLPGSIAIDTGEPGIMGAPLFDQRTSPYTRIMDGNSDGIVIIDIGAYEVQDTGPRITDVVIRGTILGEEWASGVEYSFADRIAVGEQLRSLPTAGANTIDIHFDMDVTLDGTEFSLLGTNNTPITMTYVGYDSINHIATWTVGNMALPLNKFAIYLTDDVVDAMDNSRRLNGDWDNEINTTTDGHLTPDTWQDDIHRTFITGNSVAGSESSGFRFHFALLPGDFDGDGLVEVIEGNDLNDNGIIDLDEVILGDGDGDGDGDAADDAIRLANEGTYLPLTRYGGDFTGVGTNGSEGTVPFHEEDEVVDARDYLIWAHSFGPDAGDFDGGDFLAWQAAFGDFSAWYTGTTASSATPPQALVGSDVPNVLNVIISGSISLHDPFSLDTVDGSGDQLRTIPVGGADTISIVFNEDVNVSGSSLTVIGLTTANMPTLAEFSFDTETNTATWRYEGWALGDRFLLMLSDSVTDTEGNALDGEWINPANLTTTNTAVSTFPSGDGTPGGAFNFMFTLLSGDANLDNVVNSLDLGILATNFGSMPLGALFTDADFSGDGGVHSGDLNLLAINWNENLQNTWVLADIDGDFDVDGADLSFISGNIGMSNPTLADGDLNGDGVIDFEDLDLAFAEYGLDFDWVA